MQKVVKIGEVVYQCTVCNRKTRIPVNRRGMDTLHNCIITSNCKGKLTRVLLSKDINTTPTLTPEVSGLNDWFQRKNLYTHNQIIASDTWNIKHDLSNHPIAQVFLNKSINGKNELQSTNEFTVDILDGDNISLKFNKVESGIAQIITLSSENTTNVSTQSSITSSQTIQISNNTGVLTVATLSADPVISVALVFNVTDQQPVIINYNNIDDIPSVSSPWAGNNKVFINGKIYTIRTIDIVNHVAAIPQFLSGRIPPQGGSFYVHSVNNSSISHHTLLVLNANSPYSSIDKIYNTYEDLGIETSTSSKIFYSFGKVYADSSVVKSIYPYISVVSS